MEILRAPDKIDKSKFAPENLQAEAMYGLTQEVKFCSRCVISNQRPNSDIESQYVETTKKTTIRFHDDGICDACRLFEEREGVDWVERERELQVLCDRHRRNDGRYDCIVPGSGGKDSFYAAHVLKHKYGMHPLTVTWAPHIYTDWGWENFMRWIHAGFDNQLFTPNGQVHRLLTRLATEVLYHPFQPFVVGQKHMPARMSLLYDVPLVFYGEQPSEYGTPKEDSLTANLDQDHLTIERDKDIYLSGVSVESLKKDFGLDDNALEPYMASDPNQLHELGTEIVCLGYYLPWHPQGNYYYAKEKGNFQPAPERTAGTYSKYSGIDDRIDDFHFYTTFIKFGIGRSTYDAAQEIRCGDITRDEGVALVKRYDGEFPERFSKEVFEYLSVDPNELPTAAAMFEHPHMDREYFDRLTDKFRSPHIWKHENGEWKLRRSVWQDSNA